MPRPEYVRVDPSSSDDLLALRELAQASLIRRGLDDQAKALDDPAHTVRVEVEGDEGDENVVVYLDDRPVYIVPLAAVEIARNLVRAKRANMN